MRKDQIITSIWMIVYSIFSLILVSKVSNLIDSLSHFSFNKKDSILFLFYLVLFIIVSFISQYYFNRLPILGKNVLVKKLYSNMLSRDYGFFEKNDESKLNSLFQNDIQTLGSGLAVNPVSIIYQSVTFILIVCMMIYYHALLTVLLFCVISLCFFLTSVISKKIAKYNNDVFAQRNVFIQKITESIRAHSIVSTLYKEKVYENKMNDFLNQHLQKDEFKQSFYQALYITIYIILSIALPLACVGLGIMFVYSNQLTIGKLLAMYALITQAQEPIRQLAELRTASESMNQLKKRIKKVFDKQGDCSLSEQLQSVDKIEVNIDEFGYEKPILKNLHYEIQKGDKVWISGESGCGKTTLLKLIMGFIHTEHSILINGIDVNKIQNLYDHILLVDQNSYIFDASIYDNITMYDSFTEEEFNEVVSLCQLDELIEDKGRDYMLNSSLNISGGQAQRICLARMLIRKPEIILLDEPTSALDEDTSKAFTKALKKYLDKYHMTLLVVSHKKDITSICTCQLNLQKSL